MSTLAFKQPQTPTQSGEKLAAEMLARIDDRSFKVATIGLGYVGLPLILSVAEKNFPALGIDVDAEKIKNLRAGKSYIKHLSDERIGQTLSNDKFAVTTEIAQSAECDAVIICLPTPLTKQRDPDLSYITHTCEQLVPHVRRGQLFVLESTTWPGTTREVMIPILEKSGLKSGEDFFVAFSPEREDPGNPDFDTRSIPKVVGGDGVLATKIAEKLYGQFISKTVVVSSPETAEAVKLTENIFRSVNIALVNELKVVYDAMGIDVWEVIDAAKTKPFGFMAFYPGPGLGGHCIPIDPFYLTWKAREYDLNTRFIELAGEIIATMPRYVLGKLIEGLDSRYKKSLNGSRILLLGMAYKKNVDDMRETPTLKIMDLLLARGAKLDFHDPYVPVVPMTREHPEYAGLKSVPLNAETVAGYDAVVVVTDHDNVDYDLVCKNARLVVDTRNACNKVENRDNIVKA